MRILAADDDLVSRLALEDVLRRCGEPEVVLAVDGASAWAALDGDACFDLLCLDLRMPPPDGLELLARVRATPGLARVPAMLVTASTDREILQDAHRAGLQGFLVKPLGDEAVGRIERVLAQLDAGILEPAATASARLRIDGERHARYLAAFAQQLRALAALVVDAQGDAAARSTFAQRAQACRTAALTLGAPRLEQLVADAAAALAQGGSGAGRAMAQATYWLSRRSVAMRLQA